MAVLKLNAFFTKKYNVCLLIILFVLLWLYLRSSDDHGSIFSRFGEPVFRRNFNRVSSSRDEFCLVSYNILNDPPMNVTGIYLPLSNQEISKEIDGKNSRRHKQMMKEIKWLNADVINLQEVQEFYFPILVEEFEALGFKGDYDLHHEGSNGVAIFYRSDRFQKKKTQAHNYNDLLGKFCEGSGLKVNTSHDEQRIIKFTLLEEHKSGKQLVIANTHTMFGEWKFPDMHALQIALFLRQLHEFISLVGSNHPIPWLISGDFNTYPHFPVYELITTGKLSETGLDKINPVKYKYPQVVPKNPVGDGESLFLKNCKNKFSHSLQDLKSAYSTILGSEPPLTHYQINLNFPELYGFDIMKGTLDYIFYSSDSLKVNAVLEPVKEEVIKPLVACPNKYFPSDHLSLKACFSFKQ